MKEVRSKKKQHNKRAWRIKRAAKWLLISAVAVVGGYTLVAADAIREYNQKHAHEEPRLGVSFSVKYAREMGLDWKQTYASLMDDMNIKRFRLMSYWDEIEQRPDVYTWDDLDHQFREAEKRGAKVSLAIGYRQPRWPECHMPTWASPLSKPQRWEELYQFMGDVVDRYKGSPALVSYQLENEALNTAFGICDDWDRSRLIHEFKLVKERDPHHPIAVSVANEFGIPFGQPRGDIVGFSVYKRVYQRNGGFYFNYPLPSIWHGSRGAVVEKYLKRPVMIHELQTEPWGPEGTVKLSIEEQNKSMDAERLKKHVDYALASGIKEIYLWGGEWWYWRKNVLNEPTVWDAAYKVFNP
jgi:hypothetical protein